MRKMDNRLNLDSDVRELKLGSTFTNPSPRTVFHTLKYDFKPASVDVSKPATLEVSSNKQVTVTVPHLDGSGVPNTVFKGNQRDYTRKECVIIIDRVTGEITLEKLNSNVQVKKTRAESKAVQPPPPPPQIKVENSTARLSSKTKITTGSRKNNPISFVPKHSPLQNSPSYHPNKSPLSAPAWNANNTQQTLPSIPIIGLDDGSDFMSLPSSSLPPSQSQSQMQRHELQQQQQQQQQQMHHGGNTHNTSGGSSSSSGSMSNRETNHHSGNSSNSNNHQNSHQNSVSNHGGSAHVGSMVGLGSNNVNHHNPYNNHHGETNVEVSLPSRSHASPPRNTEFSTGVLSSSSSDSSGSSDSDSGSESDSTTEDNNDSPVKGSSRSEPASNARSLPTHLLTEDLCLSESNSDSD
ncbi:ell-associated factor Eaf isoform X2 [Malaya genurostris]|uniref:ell-associated factor Eaf isoform X2 n=1 Tax=Malaya genurostris TaxID=325434 RepID=UPI0026F3C748|nr:ell-associated factor Eaf isoform X2 [Malaya genurostris]